MLHEHKNNDRSRNIIDKNNGDSDGDSDGDGSGGRSGGGGSGGGCICMPVLK